MILDLKDSYGPVFLRGACCLAAEESWVHENHLHSSSFSWVNPLHLTQLPLCIGPSDTISICCNYGDPHPLLAQPHKHTHTKHTAHWCNSCCLGGHGRLWVGSINVMVHTHKCSHTHIHNLIIDEGLLTSPRLLRDILQLMRTHKHCRHYRPP